MGKSLGNWVGIDESPEEQFGKLMSIPDSLTARYAELCTDLGTADVAALREDTRRGGRAANRAKRTMAGAVVRLYHGAEAAEAAEARFDAVFRLHRAPSDVPTVELPRGDDDLYLPGLLVTLGFARSGNEGRRLIRSGAVRVDGDKVPADRTDLPRQELAGMVLSVGRRNQVRLSAPDPGQS